MTKSLSTELRAVLNTLNLTVYGASQIIGAETDEDLKTIHRRWQRWLESSPETWRAIAQDLSVLGYDIVVKPKTK